MNAFLTCRRPWRKARAPPGSRRCWRSPRASPAAASGSSCAAATSIRAFSPRSWCASWSARTTSSRSASPFRTGPGVLGVIATRFGQLGANILEVEHRRLFLDVPAKGAKLDVTVETRDAAHADEIFRALARRRLRAAAHRCGRGDGLRAVAYCAGSSLVRRRHRGPHALRSGALGARTRQRRIGVAPRRAVMSRLAPRQRRRAFDRRHGAFDDFVRIRRGRSPARRGADSIGAAIAGRRRRRCRGRRGGGAASSRSQRSRSSSKATAGRRCAPQQAAAPARGRAERARPALRFGWRRLASRPAAPSARGGGCRGRGTLARGEHQRRRHHDARRLDIGADEPDDGPERARARPGSRKRGPAPSCRPRRAPSLGFFLVDRHRRDCPMTQLTT